MKNNYLLISSDYDALKEKQDELIKKHSFLDASLSSYDLEENTFSEILEDIDTYNFLSSNKIIIINNITLLKYDDNKKDFDHLFKYLDNPRDDVLIFFLESSINNTLKVVKELKKKCEVIEISMDSKSYIKSLLKGYKIDNETVNLLDEYCLGDISKIKNECLKLINYKYDEKVIDKNDIFEIVVKKLGDSKDLTFAFTRSLAERNVSEALKEYRELLSYNIEPISLVGLLASQFRIMLQVKLLEDRRLSDNEIANMLGEKSTYRIKKTKELTRFYTLNELLRLIIKLEDVDLAMKSTDADYNSLIELFILNVNKE